MTLSIGLAWAQSPIRMMPLGDSITAGGTNLPSQPNVPFTFGYRAELYTTLTNTGYSMQYVGNSWDDTPAGGPCVDLDALDQDHHEGYGGRGTAYLLDGIANWTQADNPDVVLLMVGINDIGETASGHPLAVQKRLSQIVETVTTIKPTAHVIVAQITPYARYTDAIVQYNSYIKDVLVPTYASQGKLVTTVDQYFNILTPSNPSLASNGYIDPALFSNDINHPSPEGYRRMAQTWFEGIQSLGWSPRRPCRPKSV
jgi:lysophospholipase L1-like esterase